jgi:undecaprenyl diphosphate synthase
VKPGILPRHIAFIMDGNGRWATNRGLPRVKGHERGARAIRLVMEELLALGIPEATFYALSSENYERRPAREVARLLDLLVTYLKSQEKTLLAERIRLVVIGRTAALPAAVQAEIRRVETLTARHDRLVFRLAINYGSRQEIMDAALAFAAAADADRRAPDALRPFLYDPTMTDPDLLVRTGGQSRLSNFLLWQCSYTELYFTETLWPSFGKPQLHEAVEAYARTTRKFGAVK